MYGGGGVGQDEVSSPMTFEQAQGLSLRCGVYATMAQYMRLPLVSIRDGERMPPAGGDAMRTGTVSFWHSHRGYGFIQPDEQREPPVWVSYTTLGDGFTEPVPYLLKGERVLYEAVPSAASQTDPRQEAVRVEPARRIHGVVRHYSLPHGHGSIESDDGTRWFLHHANLLEEGYVGLSEGTELHFIASEDEAPPGRDRIAMAVKLADPRPELYRFAQFPNELDRWLEPLADKAAPERWDYRHELAGQRGPRPILRHYLEATFERLLQERRLGRPTILEGERPDGRRYAVFNTGLLDKLQKPIYALFDEHHTNSYSHAWWWQGFFTEDDRAILDVASLPAPAGYLDDPSALLITPEEVRSMRVDSRHILVDHAERLPARLRADPTMARKLLEGDLHQLVDRVRRNYRLAVAQYYRGAVQLLLPLDLDEVPGERPLALVVERTESGARRASTVLGVDLAYRQARVVAHLDGEWLARAWLAPGADGGAPGLPCERRQEGSGGAHEEVRGAVRPA